MTIGLWVLLGVLEGAPSHDLGAEVAARTEEARRELGRKAGVETVEGVFVLAAPTGDLNATARLTRSVLSAYFNQRFSRRPERAISVYLFSEPRSYEAYCQQRWREGCISPYGFYRRDERRIVMNIGPGVGTLTHELVHPIVEADFPRAPEWLNEGIASLFEAFALPGPGQIRGVKNWRHPRLLRALRTPRERRKVSLPGLFGLDDATFRNVDEDLNYATARYLCQWLDQRGQLWDFYQRFRDHYLEDPTGERAFVAATGKTPARANDEWVRWVKRL